MKKTSISIWDVLIWVGIIIILGWAILKSLGIINSPVWVEMVPYFGLGASAIGGAYKLGKIMQGIEKTQENVDKLLKIEDEFKDIRTNQKLCMEGKLDQSPYKREL